jgi:hypothetical protein
MQNKIVGLEGDVRSANADINEKAREILELKRKLICAEQNLKESKKDMLKMNRSAPTGLSSQLKRCLQLSEMLCERVRDKVLEVETKVISEASSKSRCTVGIMFDELGEVKNVMIGGPAYLSKNVFRGDLIVEVNGKLIEGSRLSLAIIGDDMPGSFLSLTLRRGKEFVSVTLKRMMTAEVADKRRMFDLFTCLIDRAKRNEDEEGAQFAQKALLFWERVMTADQEHGDQIVQNVERMQKDCMSLSNEIYRLLKALDLETPSVPHPSEGGFTLNSFSPVITPGGTPARASLTLPDPELDVT